MLTSPRKDETAVPTFGSDTTYSSSIIVGGPLLMKSHSGTDCLKISSHFV